MNRTPLSLEKLFALKPGDTFVVYWAKDDDSDDVRCDYDVQTIEKNEGGEILTTCMHAWSNSRSSPLGGNQLDTCRGVARFYEAPGPSIAGPTAWELLDEDEAFSA